MQDARSVPFSKIMRHIEPENPLRPEGSHGPFGDDLPVQLRKHERPVMILKIGKPAVFEGQTISARLIMP
jgi:hypothetical protein